jgi:diguanylate cyclase (GGDEF)-like protein
MEPLYQIASAFQKIPNGEFEKLPVVKDTEIGLLTEQFNAMSQALKEKIGGYEQSISKEKKVIRDLNILNELNSSLIFKLNVHEVLEVIVSFSEPLVKSDIRAIVVVDNFSHSNTRFYTSFHKNKDELADISHSIVQEFFKNNGVPIRLSESSEDERFKKITGGKHITIKNFLAVPLSVEGTICGALIFFNKTEGRGFEIEEEDSAVTVSIQAAAAIEKALFHEATVHLAKTDGLTSLSNHRTFHEALDFEIQRAKRFNRELSLLFIDIDHFKVFNDTYGHQAGDQVLKELAGIVRSNLRSIDSAARYGGEEFTIILPETLPEGAVKTAERIRDEIRRHTFDIGGNRANLTVSIGIATFPDDAFDKERLIKAADNALYMAKRKGRNLIITSREYSAEIAKSQ